MKKRLLAMLLATASVFLASCSTVSTPDSAPVEDSATASSDASSYATWLAGRIGGEVKDNKISLENSTVTLSVDGGEYSVDTVGLRKNGYIIRTEESDTVIIARTAEGMDSGVRKYAAVVEKTGNYNVNHTEGLKIGKVTLGGADLSNFKILLPTSDDANAPFNANATEAMGAAADELTAYIETATGITLVTEYVTDLHTMTDAQILEACGNAIVLLSDPTAKSGSSLPGEPGEMGTESYKLTVADGIMRILGGNQRGCLYGVYDFLENFIGWRFLAGGDEYLYDADELVIDDVEVEFTPTFGYRAIKFPGADGCNDGKINSPYHPELKNNCMNAAGHAHASYWGHGVGSTGWHAHSFADQLKDSAVEKGTLHYGDQPCFADEYTKEVVIESVLNMIEMRQGYPWYNRIGYEMVQLGVSMNDNTNFCKCSDCMDVVRASSFADLYLNFVNDVAAVVAEKYPGILINTAIYNAARKPPKETVPAENVSIYYCVQGCNQHILCTEECAKYSTTLGYKNTLEREYLEEWTKICDKVYVWYYAVSFFSNLSPCPNIYEIYDDVTYVASLGVLGFYSEGDSVVKNNFENLKAYLFAKLTYDADVTREEFFDMIDEYITLVYGEESAPYIREYLNMHQQSGDVIDGCFINNYHYPFDMMDFDYYKNNYEFMYELFNNAVRYARDAECEKKIIELRLHMEFMGLSATYDSAYVNGTAESRAEYEKRYKWLVDAYRNANLTTDRVGVAAPADYDLSQNPTFKFISELIRLSKEERA